MARVKMRSLAITWLDDEQSLLLTSSHSLLDSVKGKKMKAWHGTYPGTAGPAVEDSRPVELPPMWSSFSEMDFSEETARRVAMAE